MADRLCYTISVDLNCKLPDILHHQFLDFYPGSLGRELKRKLDLNAEMFSIDNAIFIRRD